MLCDAAQTYEHLKKELIRIERMMLREFGFIVHVEHPHKLVLNHLHMMLNTEHGLMHEELMQEAWSLTNDRWVTLVLCISVMCICTVEHQQIVVVDQQCQ